MYHYDEGKPTTNTIDIFRSRLLSTLNFPHSTLLFVLWKQEDDEDEDEDSHQHHYLNLLQSIPRPSHPRECSFFVLDCHTISTLSTLSLALPTYYCTSTNHE